MPVYDYGCGACGHIVEVIHGIHVPGPRFCPACGVEGRMRKGFTAPAVHFKGSGWAKKDRSATASPGRAKPAETTTDRTATSDTGPASAGPTPAPSGSASASSDSASGTSNPPAGSSGGGD